MIETYGKLEVTEKLILLKSDHVDENERVVIGGPSDKAMVRFRFASEDGDTLITGRTTIPFVTDQSDDFFITEIKKMLGGIE